jgi:hypothetical protein
MGPFSHRQLASVILRKLGLIPGVWREGQDDLRSSVEGVTSFSLSVVFVSVVRHCVDIPSNFQGYMHLVGCLWCKELRVKDEAFLSSTLPVAAS